MIKKHVAVVMGGYSSEFEISLQSGSVVCESLDSNIYFIYPVHLLKDGWNYVSDEGIVDKYLYIFAFDNYIYHNPIFNQKTSLPSTKDACSSYAL